MDEMKTYRGFKVLAEDLDSIAKYNYQALGVWKGCPNPEQYLRPDPKRWKEGDMTYLDSNVIVNVVLENPDLKEGETARMKLLLGLHPSEDRLITWSK